MKPDILSMLALGALAGVCSGIFGVGGGIILIPILIFFFNYSAPAASGTSLVALLLPVGLLGVIEYYRAGKINMEHIHMGLLIAVGLFFGTYLGAKVAVYMPIGILQRVFAVFLLGVAAKLWFSAAV